MKTTNKSLDFWDRALALMWVSIAAFVVAGNLVLNSNHDSSSLIAGLLLCNGLYHLRFLITGDPMFVRQKPQSPSPGPGTH